MKPIEILFILVLITGTCSLHAVEQFREFRPQPTRLDSSSNKGFKLSLTEKGKLEKKEWDIRRAQIAISKNKKR